jgi:hypothetical protein
MKLAIVIPALDEADNLARLLPELARECPGAEIVVVDGAAATRPRRWWRARRGRGCSRARAGGRAR